jgi:ABC-2 type transport system ATP-binding protein
LKYDPPAQARASGSAASTGAHASRENDVGHAVSVASAATEPVPERVISARDVVKRYGRTVALAGLSADIGPGITGLLGSNGAGKTTFMSLVLGLRKRDGGELTVLGHDPATAGIEMRARIGYAPEHHELPSELAASDLVRHLAEMHLLPRRAAMQRANEALWLVGLGEERFRPVGTMSTGQRQRVKLAGAIAHDPELVLLDEPTDGLDPLQRTTMLDLIRRIGTEFGLHIVVSSHHLEEVERICDSVVIVEGGVVVRAGALADVRRGPEGLVVEVDDRAEELAAVLRASGLDVTVAGSVLLLGPHEAAHVAVRDAVADLALGLRRLEPRGRTLEDVYLGTGQ